MGRVVLAVEGFALEEVEDRQHQQIEVLHISYNHLKGVEPSVELIHLLQLVAASALGLDGGSLIHALRRYLVSRKLN